MAALAPRHVHFESLNWEEEEQRTQRGVQSRREKRRQRLVKTEHRQAQADRRARIQKETFIMLVDLSIEPRLVRFCNGNDAVNLTLGGFLDRTDVARNGDAALSVRLADLRRDMNHSGMSLEDWYDTRLDDGGYQFLYMIGDNPNFRDEFFPQPGQISSDPSFDTQEHREELNREVEEAMHQAGNVQVAAVEAEAPAENAEEEAPQGPPPADNAADDGQARAAGEGARRGPPLAAAADDDQAPDDDEAPRIAPVENRRRERPADEEEHQRQVRRRVDKCRPSGEMPLETHFVQQPTETR